MMCKSSSPELWQRTQWRAVENRRTAVPACSFLHGDPGSRSSVLFDQFLYDRIPVIRIAQFTARDHIKKASPRSHRSRRDRTSYYAYEHDPSLRYLRQMGQTDGSTPSFIKKANTCLLFLLCCARSVFYKP